MTEEQLREALEWKKRADNLRHQIDTFVLLKRDAHIKEVVCFGEPVLYNKSEYHRVQLPISDEVRRYCFRVWKREKTIEYNECCRKLAQFGVISEHSVRELPDARP